MGTSPEVTKLSLPHTRDPAQLSMTRKNHSGPYLSILSFGFLGEVGGLVHGSFYR